ncbi:MAG: NAD(P)/FAD-dependent oxidoreductase [Pseudorhodobacter sp.]
MNLLHANDQRGEYPPSWYAATATPLAPFPILKGAVEADIGIVGGGYTGLSAALHLAKAGFHVVLLEAHRVGFGASGRNGGQMGSGQRLEQDVLENTVGKDRAHALWDLAEDAKALVRSLIDQYTMPVSFRPGIAHACYGRQEVDHARKLADKLTRDYGYPHLEPLPAGLIGSKAFAGGIIDRGAGHIHPLNFAIGLARAAIAAGVVIHEKSEVHNIVHGQQPILRTDSGQVRCKHVVLAGNGYLGRFDRKISSRVMPINNFIIATEPLGDRAKQILSEPVAVCDTKFVVNYWRLSDDNRLLFGGGESYGYRFPDIVKTVRKPMLAIYPQLRDIRIDHAWGGTLAITPHRLPCFLRPRPYLWAAAGYSGHGVALATLAGKLMARAISGQEGGFDLMASLPQPRFPGGAALRWPLLVTAMSWYAMRDRLGI